MAGPGCSASYTPTVELGGAMDTDQAGRGDDDGVSDDVADDRARPDPEAARRRLRRRRELLQRMARELGASTEAGDPR